MDTLSQPLDAQASVVTAISTQQTQDIPAETFAQAARLGLAEQLPEVAALTRELFGTFTIDISEDPEIPSCTDVSFEVVVHGTVEDCVERTSEWHKRLPHWPPDASGSFSLVTRFAS